MFWNAVSLYCWDEPSIARADKGGQEAPMTRRVSTGEPATDTHLQKGSTSAVLG